MYEEGIGTLCELKNGDLNFDLGGYFQGHLCISCACAHKLCLMNVLENKVFKESLLNCQFYTSA